MTEAMCPSEPASPQDNPPPQLLAALLLGKKFLECRILSDGGKVNILSDLHGVCETVIQ
jgi:hypothetical protein